ncbi:MAG: transporter substrate-binding domain-containing protein [Tagaea sp.]
MFRSLFTAAALAAGFVVAGFAGLASAQPARLVTGVDGTFAPHAMPRLGGGIEGFNVDMANEIARRLGRPIEIQALEFSGLIPGLLARRFDFVAAPTTVTEARARTLLFTEGYLATDYQFATRRGAPEIKALDDVRGKKLAVNKGSAYESWANDNAQRLGFTFDVYGSNPEAVQAVLAGRADANLAGNTVVAWAAKQNRQLVLGHTIRTGLVWAIPFRPDDKEGRDRVSMVVKCMKLDGTFSRLHEKWFGYKAPADSVTMQPSAGHGVPGLPGYDETPVTPVCR